MTPITLVLAVMGFFASAPCLGECLSMIFHSILFENEDGLL